MAYTLIAHGNVAGANSGTTSALDTTGADFLVIHLQQSKTASEATISDSKGNTWNQLTLQSCASGDVMSRLYYAKNVTVGSGHTFSFSGTSVFGSIEVQAWSGSHLTAPFDVENGAVDGSPASRSTGSVTPSQDNSLLVAGLASGGGDNSGTTIDLGFTVSDVSVYSAGVNFGGAIAYLVETISAAKNPTWTFNFDFGAANIAVFKPAGGAVVATGPAPLGWFDPELEAGRYIDPEVSPMCLLGWFDREWTAPSGPGGLLQDKFARLIGGGALGSA